jgi:hypothetical protein
VVLMFCFGGLPAGVQGDTGIAIPRPSGCCFALEGEGGGTLPPAQSCIPVPIVLPSCAPAPPHARCPWLSSLSGLQCLGLNIKSIPARADLGPPPLRRPLLYSVP